eukprot:CAMPEP_0177770868 /NCGR_PEP_ID=MMETSP0491_2-20121128/11203_1 /TAXON_ID=63592 /ORGANISM="Tetraselmis chuii, Strain PLY429" /LENGTH=199 /DNA_ID=CAMNT_0019288209 /DNA_START=83 /DNA_END=682 /DNA_ORIENTATION=-
MATCASLSTTAVRADVKRGSSGQNAHRCLPCKAIQPALSRRSPAGHRAVSVVAMAKKKNRPSMLDRYGSDADSRSTGSGDEDTAGWLDVGVTTADFVSKSTKPVVLANGDAIVVYKVGDKYYCSDANSTAFRYPMVDAKVVVDKNGEPVAEVPFDGTVYNLRTGDVITWCPKNNLFRSVIGSLKDKSEPVPITAQAPQC